MSGSDVRPRPRPRLTQALVGLVLLLQAVFAWAGISGAADPGATLAAGAPLGVIVLAGFAVYGAIVLAYLAAAALQARPLRQLGMAAAGAGIGLALLRFGTGEPVEGLLFGMAIDAFLVYGLRRPDIRALFPA